jgi:release factor glutamine methyltransferase
VLLQEAAALRVARSDAEVLLTHALGCQRTTLRAFPEREVDAGEAAQARSWLQRRANGEPVAYIVGQREFWSLPLRVAPATLIPRPDTESLVELALSPRLAPPATARAASLPAVVDLGTGTGAIALALAAERPQWAITATDTDASALAVAESNVRRLAQGNITLCQGDWWAACAGQRFDLAVSNPPYLAADDPHLTAGDLRFEPRRALVSGTDGLDAIRTIALGAATHLKPGAWLAVEHGCEQGEQVRAVFMAAGLTAVFTVTDLAARERVTAGCWEG